VCGILLIWSVAAYRLVLPKATDLPCIAGTRRSYVDIVKSFFYLIEASSFKYEHIFTLVSLRGEWRLEGWSVLCVHLQVPAIFGHYRTFHLLRYLRHSSKCVQITFRNDIAKASAACCAVGTVRRPLLVLIVRADDSSRQLPTLRQWQWSYEQ
jgi:hypothetical protein